MKTRGSRLPTADGTSGFVHGIAGQFVSADHGQQEVDDLAEVAERFARHEVELVDSGDGQFMQIADPDGSVIEVWQSPQEHWVEGGIAK